MEWKLLSVQDLDWFCSDLYNILRLAVSLFISVATSNNNLKP